MQRSPLRDLPWLRVTMARAACCLGLQPPLHRPDLAWHSPALPCPGQEDGGVWLQVDYLGTQLGGEVVHLQPDAAVLLARARQRRGVPGQVRAVKRWLETEAAGGPRHGDPQPRQ